ncbi:MAG: tryptophan-rich sensory protein [Armatimonadota bacterium]|jgi:tryptophan-rich sensory protein
MISGREALGLGVAVVVCFGASALGAVYTGRSIPDWYATLQKPAWTPPGWVFGPVWTALYVSMAVAAWVVWRQKGFAGSGLPMGLFAVQLLLNAAWSPVFFGCRMPGAAFGVIVLLWVAILATIAAFWRASPVAAALLVPYQAWVTFAAALNYAIWRLNA